jgi:NAD(P)-dependent dehydrogenase (short-subunit alcohol dehydrogenase family)
MPAVLVTGASTGIGEATALHLDGLGHHVFASVRKEEDGERLRDQASDRLTPLLFDVTDEKAVGAAAETVTETLGATRFAGVVNNAGIGMGGPLEYLSLDDWRQQFEVNVLGQVVVTKAFLPLVRDGHGRIVFIGSISGRCGTALMGPYTGSKFAIEGIAEALRLELHPWDIKVSVVEPGAIKTAIWEKGRAQAAELTSRFPPEAVDRYRAAIDMITRGIDYQDEHGIAPVGVAKAVEHALFAPRPRLRYVVGNDAKVTALMSRFMPDSAKDAIVRRIAGRI